MMWLSSDKALLTLGAVALALTGAPAYAQRQVPPSEPVSRLLRDTDRAESVRAVKTLQVSYAQYAQAGLWSEMASLFGEKGVLAFGSTSYKGAPAIKAFLKQRFGEGADGIPAGGLNVHFALNPIVIVAANGETATGRWHEVSLTGRFGRHAEWAGGMMDNDYVRENGVWKIARLTYTPQMAGAYADGWRNVADDSPVVPFRFTAQQAGMPIEPMSAAAFLPPPEGNERDVLQAVATRIQALSDEVDIRNLQNAYGYYVTQKMWSDVADLIAPDGTIQVAGVGQYRGAAGIRRYLASLGPASLRHGELNNHAQLDALVSISPDGSQARIRGLEWNFLGQTDQEKGWWEIRVFDNSLVKRADGKWVFSALRLLPVMKADYDLGWAKSAITDPAPVGADAPDVPEGPLAQTPYIAEFAAANPVTGQIPRIDDAKSPWAAPVPWAAGQRIVAPTSIPQGRLALDRTIAYDAIENISSAFGDYLSDHQAVPVSELLHPRGMREGPFSGFFIGKDRLRDEELVDWGREPAIRSVIRTHLRLQPVINVSPDGRSGKVRSWLLLLPSDRATSLGFYDGMYNDEVVLDEGRWKFWSIAIDDIYFQARSYKEGWARAKDRAVSAFPDHVPATILNIYPPDIPLSKLGRRQEGQRGGPTKPIEWPSIKPMWFQYPNPVSGRLPPNYWPDCVTCAVDPATSLVANGYKW